MALTPQDEFRLFNLGKAVDFAVEAFRSTILINGGAAIALLAFASADAHLNPAGLKRSLVRFGIGALVATLGLVIAYVAQLLFADASHVGLTEPKRKSAEGWATCLRFAGAACFFLSVVAFVAGVITASKAIFPS